MFFEIFQQLDARPSNEDLSSSAPLESEVKQSTEEEKIFNPLNSLSEDKVHRKCLKNLSSHKTLKIRLSLPCCLDQKKRK